MTPALRGVVLTVLGVALVLQLLGCIYAVKSTPSFYYDDDEDLHVHFPDPTAWWVRPGGLTPAGDLERRHLHYAERCRPWSRQRGPPQVGHCSADIPFAGHG